MEEKGKIVDRVEWRSQGDVMDVEGGGLVEEGRGAYEGCMGSTMCPSHGGLLICITPRTL